jgi:uncharacterized membrane protein
LKRRRLRISRKYLQYVIAFAIIATVVASTLAYVTLNPPPEEHFFASWILGSQGMAANYYPNNNPNIGLREEVRWTLGVYNHMGSLQYVVLRVKLLNSTMISPNDALDQPSTAPAILEFARVLVNNETWSIPFAWEMLNSTVTGGHVTITNLSINQTSLTGQFASAVSGYNFRFIFELWYYDTTTNNLAFSWRADGQVHSVWTQIWFNATQTQP